MSMAVFVIDIVLASGSQVSISIVLLVLCVKRVANGL